MREILIVRLSAMGDIIHALPAAASLKQTFPEARMTWVMNPRWTPLFEGSGLVDRIIRFNRKDYGSWGSVASELREAKFDLAVDFQGLIQSGIVTRLARARTRVGFASRLLKEKAAAWFYSRRVDSTAAHVVEKNLDLAAGAGALVRSARFALATGRAEGTLPDEPFVLASPLAGWTSKQWPLEYYERLAALMRGKLGMPLVLNGAPGMVPSVSGALTHESGIAGLIDATRRAALVVGVDSGPLHLAAALDKAGVAIFGPTDPLRNGPYGGDFAVFRADGVVTTHKRGTAIDPAMRAITPEQVFPALAARIGCNA